MIVTESPGDVSTSVIVRFESYLGSQIFFTLKKRLNCGRVFKCLKMRFKSLQGSVCEMKSAAKEDLRYAV